ncbi:MAG TPA: DUF4242 domain-containing protein [Caldimonas sp.]|nr:DUF4242 domain-containing protein [Caldimonas sp.]
MPRYLIKRTFPDGVRIPSDVQGAEICAAVIRNNAARGVNWIHSYVSDDRRTTFCIYDGPSPDAIREVAGTNSLPVDSITPVRVLDPYFHHLP